MLWPEPTVTSPTPPNESAAAIQKRGLSRSITTTRAISAVKIGSVPKSSATVVAVGSGGNLSANLKGDGLAVLGAVTWAGYSVGISPLMRRYSPFRLSAVFLAAVTVPLALAGSHQLANQSFDFGALVWVGFAFAVLGPLVITNFLWFTAIDRVGPSRAALFANLQPFLAAIIALLLLSEHITTLQIVGGLGVAGGIVLASRRAPAPEPPAE